jgi:hypothetical protein
MVILQAALGISTLLMHVPVPLASLHQAGAMGALTFIILFLHFLGGPRARYLTKLIPLKNMVQVSTMNHAAKFPILLMAAGSHSAILDWKSKSENLFGTKF